MQKYDKTAGYLHISDQNEGSTIKVECRRLSEFLQEPVHFLKLDIEGSEDVVIAESGAYLSNVQHIFFEYHHRERLGASRLLQILDLLDQAAFDIRIAKSYSNQIATKIQPMRFFSSPYSAVIWAKNRNWEHGVSKREVGKLHE